MIVGIDNILQQYMASKEVFWRVYYVANNRGQESLDLLQESHGNTLEENREELKQLIQRIAPNKYYIRTTNTVRSDGDVSWNKAAGFYFVIPTENATSAAVGGTFVQPGVNPNFAPGIMGMHGWTPPGYISLEMHNLLLEQMKQSLTVQHQLEKKIDKIGSKNNDSSDLKFIMHEIIGAIKDFTAPAPVPAIGTKGAPEQPVQTATHQNNEEAEANRHWAIEVQNEINRMIKNCDGDAIRFLNLFKKLNEKLEKDTTLLTMFESM